MREQFRKALTFVIWPILLGGCLMLTHIGIDSGHPFLYFNIAYVCLALSIFAIEQLMPHERRWLENDGQMGSDLGHTILSKLVAQLWVAFMLYGMVQVSSKTGGAFWPKQWPMFCQVFLGLVIAEFGLYWAHRLAHEWPLLWRFHAVHHSVVRLWFFNTGRFHFVDAMVSVTLGQIILFTAGAPESVMLWVGMITPYIGFLTHCNIEMRFGPISYVFNTPGLHRWHHSREKEEGNRNYGENLMIWDQLFGTFFNPKREPSTNIGICDYVPQGFWAQIKAPLVWGRIQSEMPADAPDAMNRLSVSGR